MTIAASFRSGARAPAQGAHTMRQYLLFTAMAAATLLAEATCNDVTDPTLSVSHAQDGHDGEGGYEGHGDHGGHGGRGSGVTSSHSSSGTTASSSGSSSTS